MRHGWLQEVSYIQKILSELDKIGQSAIDKCGAFRNGSEFDLSQNRPIISRNQHGYRCRLLKV
jgi:hypothetical protein